MRKVLFILGELEDSDLQWVLDAGRPRDVPPAHELIREGGTVDNLFIVVDGEFSVRTATGVELARLGAGEVIGEMSLLDSRPAVATLVAQHPSHVFGVPFGTLRPKLQRDPAFAARFYRALCQFLANRLSRTAHLVGARGAAGEVPTELFEEEMSPDALGSLTLAGARFDWFLQQLREGRGS